MSKNNILLIEPDYKNKYPPLGLMKIAQYHGQFGKKDNVRFIKGNDTSVFTQSWDRIYITTLFSFEWKSISRTIDFAIQVVNGCTDKIFVGGIAASLMHEKFLSVSKWHGIRFISGLLDKAPAISLQLDDFNEELYSDDIAGKPIEDLIPDYGILDQIEYKYPVSDAYFAYTTRGCIRKCAFCGVPKLEGMLRDGGSLTSLVNNIEALYGPKKDLILMDNNVVASPRFHEIIAEIRDLGFTKGAKLKRGRGSVLRRVDFNQGVDARILSKNKKLLKDLNTIAIKPLRIAFDHIGMKKIYTQAVQYACDAGLKDLSNYMLYNFNDSPKDLFERMRLNVSLNEKLGIRIFSFPMRFQPTNLPDRSHIGPKWNRYFLRSMQIILQATHGIVSGSPTFFRRAFGDTYEDFENILLMPHHFIFNRDWYEHSGGRSEFNEYCNKVGSLSQSQIQQLLEFLSNHSASQYQLNSYNIPDQKIRDALHHYTPPSMDEEQKIWALKNNLNIETNREDFVPDDEKVEDAGLWEAEILSTNRETSNKQVDVGGHIEQTG